jgi:hypothetical protein
MTVTVADRTAADVNDEPEGSGLLTNTGLAFVIICATKALVTFGLDRTARFKAAKSWPRPAVRIVNPGGRYASKRALSLMRFGEIWASAVPMAPPATIPVKTIAAASFFIVLFWLFLSPAEFPPSQMLQCVQKKYLEVS